MLCHGLKARELRHAAPGAAGYCKGGSSSSSSSSAQTNIDKRMVVDGGPGISADSSSVIVTDAGQTANALALGYGSRLQDTQDIKELTQFGRGLMDVAGSVANNSLSFAEGANLRSLDFAADANRRGIDFATSTALQGSRNLDTVLDVGLNLFDRSIGLLDKAATTTREQTAAVASAYDAAQGAGSDKTLATIAVIGAVALIAVKTMGK